ncbi:MAG: hypothetical protein ABEH88_00710 [Halobacteriales archaeon]
MPSDDASPAAYCPACEHLLADRDVVKIIGRHMDGVDPTFKCPACDGEVAHPSRAPADADTYDSGRSRSDPASGSDGFERADMTTVVDAVPPLDVGEVRVGDRITVHYDEPGRTARQTDAGTVTGVENGIVFETDTRRSRRLDPVTGVLSEADEIGGGDIGRAMRVRITR